MIGKREFHRAFEIRLTVIVSRVKDRKKAEMRRLNRRMFFSRTQHSLWRGTVCKTNKQRSTSPHYSDLVPQSRVT